LPQKKPHPAPVLKAIRDMKSHTESALMVGDGIQDIQAGHAAGLRTCVARYGFGFHIESLDLKPNFQIRRFLELLDLKEIVS
jgi:phosphoglycolate phosphatase